MFAYARRGGSRGKKKSGKMLYLMAQKKLRAPYLLVEL
jgi:hypothetical protein